MPSIEFWEHFFPCHQRTHLLVIIALHKHVSRLRASSFCVKKASNTPLWLVSKGNELDDFLHVKKKKFKRYCCSFKNLWELITSRQTDVGNLSIKKYNKSTVLFGFWWIYLRNELSAFSKTGIRSKNASMHNNNIVWNLTTFLLNILSHVMGNKIYTEVRVSNIPNLYAREDDRLRGKRRDRVRDLRRRRNNSRSFVSEMGILSRGMSEWCARSDNGNYREPSL